MKKIVTLLASAMLTFGAMAQSQEPTEEMMREFRQTVQKRDISKHHLESNIPLSTQATKATKGSMKSLPTDRVWFPGEWEEVKAIAVAPYYNYLPAESQRTGYWMAKPLVTGWAQYYKYSNGWQEQGMGPYKATMDTTSAFGKVFFYLMDGIQLGGAEAWVRVEQKSDTAKVIRTLSRMGLRHDNVKFLIGPGNNFWFRDCGPICFYYGEEDSLGMLDFTYTPGRALDDSLPTIIHWQKGIPNYFVDIEWEGGNCLVDGAGMVATSDAVYNHNADRYGQLIWDGQDINSLTYKQVTPLTETEVRQALHALIGQRSTYILPAYQYDGGTGHIDLYADMYDENGFVFSVMPDTYSSWVDYQTGHRNMDSLCSYKSIFGRNYYKMGTLPFPSTDNGDNFISQRVYDKQYTRTYSNHTFVNNVILQPCFSTVGSDGMPTAAWDRANIEEIKKAYPGYTIYCVDVREFDGTGGAIHCVTKQIPADSPIRILHKNIHGSVAVGERIPVSAIITNNSGIAQAEVVYRNNGGNWQTVTLTANGNRWYGNIPAEYTSVIHNVEYYISATSNNGKTITKPMTASQGGYYSFTYTNPIIGLTDSTMFDYDTTAMDMNDITFTFGSNWATEDESEQNPQHLAIESVEVEGAFGQFFPNPASDKANLIIDLGNGADYSVTIIDNTGRTIYTGRLQAYGQVLYTVDAARLAAGVYNVVFSNSESRVVRRLIVK